MPALETRSETQPLTVAVVNFPGSNCYEETVRFFEREGHSTVTLTDKETKVPEADLLVLPGGFSYGDREYEKATGHFVENPGVQALKSSVMAVIREWATNGKDLLGICNGWQLLAHAGLLPGRLVRNDSGLFVCQDTDGIVEGRGFFDDPTTIGRSFNLNVAHGFGKFIISDEEYKLLVKNRQVVLRYLGFNPNGSTFNIAGICNQEGNVTGTMFHPERGTPEVRRLFMQAIERKLS